MYHCSSCIHVVSPFVSISCRHADGRSIGTKMDEIINVTPCHKITFEFIDCKEFYFAI